MKENTPIVSESLRVVVVTRRRSAASGCRVPSLHPCGSPLSTRNPPCKQGRAGNGGARCHSRGNGRVVVVPVPFLYTY